MFRLHATWWQTPSTARATSFASSKLSNLVAWIAETPSNPTPGPPVRRCKLGLGIQQGRHDPPRREGLHNRGRPRKAKHTAALDNLRSFFSSYVRPSVFVSILTLLLARGL